MSREVRRVPLDFDCPIGDTWPALFMPKRLHEAECPACTNGYSEAAQHMYDQWYGHAPFQPWMTESTPFSVETPAVRAFAERNVTGSPWYYGTGEQAILAEARRLLGLWNASWRHHLSQADVDALVAEDRLWDFTHTFTPEDRWQPRKQPFTVTAAEVNDWSLTGFGHDSINVMIVIAARCKREGVSTTCPTCDGHSSIEVYPGQRAEAEAWEPPEIPTGPGWQMWQTISEGGPVSPIFDTPEALADWMRANQWSHLSFKEALNFVEKIQSSIGSFIGSASGVTDGVTAAAESHE